LEKRFTNQGLVNDAVTAFSLEYDHAKDPEPADSLKNLTKHLNTDYPDFHQSWEHLQHEKESVVQDCLETDVLKGLTRGGLQPAKVWPKVLCKVDGNPESAKKAQIAKDAVELFLLVEPTNASVERDANIVRLVRDAVGNRAEADLLDSRVRMKIESPDVRQTISTSKGQKVWHPLLREAAKDFLVDKRVLHSAQAGKRMPPRTAEHKANLAASRKKRKLGVAEDLATDVRIGAASAAWGEEDPTEAATQSVQAVADIDALLEEDLDTKEFLSIAPPKKQGRGGGGGRGKGRGRGGVPLGPAAAEAKHIDEVVAQVSAGCKQDSSKQDFLENGKMQMSKSLKRLLWGSGSSVAYWKIIPLEASYPCASDGAIDKPHGGKHGPTLATLHCCSKSINNMFECPA